MAAVRQIVNCFTTKAATLLQDLFTLHVNNKGLTCNLNVPLLLLHPTPKKSFQDTYLSRDYSTHVFKDKNESDVTSGSSHSHQGPRQAFTPVQQRLIAPALLTVRHHTTDDNKKPKKHRGKTPAGKFDDKWETETEESIEPYQEQEPLEKFPDNKNPVTGEIGGPKGPEPTRYGDWERKGRVTDF